MARTGWGRHTVVATGSNDTGKQISVNAWNNDLDTDGILGFAAETISSASSITPTNSFVKLSGSTSIDTIAIANSSEGDLLYVITTGSVTLNNTSSPSSSGDIRLLGDANKDLSTTVPTILMRVSTFWYEYGGSPVTDGSVTNAQLANMAANTIKVRNAVDAGVPSDIALATTEILIGDGTGFTAAALSGDVTMTNAGAVTVGTLNQSTTGSSASCTGLSATATALATGRAIGGTSFDGTAAIDIVEITVADTTNTTCSVALFESATGELGPKSDAGLTYNAGTGMLTATGLTGPLTGNADTASNATLAAGLSSTLATTSGGTNLTSYATGDIIYASGSNTLAKLTAGSNTHVLTLTGGVPVWAAGGGGAHTQQEWDVYTSHTPTAAVADTSAYMFTEKIDTNNDGLYIQIWKNGASTTVQIA